MKVFEKEIKYRNTVLEKSFEFSVRIVKFYLLVSKNYQIQSLTKQLLKSGTSIGANLSEAQEAVSKKDFLNKLSISLKEARETEYWLKLFKETDLISQKEFISLNNDLEEIIKLLVAIIKRIKQR